MAKIALRLPPERSLRGKSSPGISRVVCLLIAALALFAGGTRAEETGYTVRQTDIKAQPAGDAATVGTLRERARVDVVRRQGAWLEIRSEGGAGWVRMLGVRMGSASASGSSASGITSVLNVARTGSSGTGIAAGVRGLDKEQIRNAQPNPAELQKLNNFSVSREEAERFAAELKLAARRIEYVADPGAN